MSLLTLQNLSVSYRTKSGELLAVDGVSFEVREDEYFGLVGESGCGKSTLAAAIIQTLPDNGRISTGRVVLRERDLAGLSNRELNRIRWRDISYISQAAQNGLDPVYRVREQIIESIRAHEPISEHAASQRLTELFALVQLDPQRLDDYPHQLSGGMKQRAIIAMALALDPALIIADEPTTALDVLVQEQILQRIREIRRDVKKSMLLITHDIGVVAENCHRVGVMYAGKLVEIGPVASVFKRPFMPYTMGLQNAFPSLLQTKMELISIPGAPPNLVAPPPGCRFSARCPFAGPICSEAEPPLVPTADDHLAACHFLDRADHFRTLAARAETWGQGNASVAKGNGFGEQTILEARDLTKWFPVRKNLFVRLFKKEQPKQLRAVDGVDLRIRRGEIVGLAGESGCGKTTTGLLALRLLVPTAGELLFSGEDIANLRGRHLVRFRRRAQIIFQDPYESLNPRFKVSHVLEEPLVIHRLGSRAERAERVRRTLEIVELRPADEYLDRFPHELSGGQRQRVAIARAIILEPDFVVADEPTSMLDVSVRAGILKLLRRLSTDLQLGFLYISHDLSTMRQICHTIAVMYLGRIVEVGPAQDVIEQSRHPYSQALIAAVPVPDPSYRRQPLEIHGSLSSPTDLPPGCRFAPRCPQAIPRCQIEDPGLRHVAPHHKVACHLY